LNRNDLMRHWYAYIYDQEVIQDDVRHIASIIGAAPLHILEVACGSGRISIPLAQAGHTVTGFDVDEFMLERIPQKASGSANLHCYKADALTADWGTGFDAVILSGNILVNIVTDGDYRGAQELFIQKAASCVRQGGHLYLDFDCVNWPDSTPDPDKEWVCFEGTDDLGTYGKYIVESGAYDSKTRMAKGTRRYEITPKDGEPFAVTQPSVKHFPTYRQVVSWLEKYGWEIDWQNPVREETYHAIFWARKR
jgi:SAM-dependent methyltransferase